MHLPERVTATIAPVALLRDGRKSIAFNAQEQFRNQYNVDYGRICLSRRALLHT